MGMMFLSRPLREAERSLFGQDYGLRLTGRRSAWAKIHAIAFKIIIIVTLIIVAPGASNLVNHNRVQNLVASLALNGITVTEWGAVLVSRSKFFIDCKYTLYILTLFTCLAAI